ncbi:hypothetical protein BDW74DRAFT_168151 [Aspergillus multicolor]|uniref:putative glycosyl transferase family 8 family n=1 Tax=Aspergillus multicolor TaxID=41759 RepID=UPI003CCD7B53
MSTQQSARPSSRLMAIVVAFFLIIAQTGSNAQADKDDVYFMGARVLTYQLLHAPATRAETPVPFIVLVTPDVQEDKRQMLRGDGALVVEVDKIKHDISIPQPRWKDTLTKLQIFNPTIVPYAKAIYLDADVILRRPIDSLFYTSPPSQTRAVNGTSQPCSNGSNLPESFLMGASVDTGLPNHPMITEQWSYFNAGFLLYIPNARLLQYYKCLLTKPELWSYGFLDQDLLNYAHHREGRMPWQQLHSSWHRNHPLDDHFNNNIASLHVKWWEGSPETPAINAYARQKWREMKSFWKKRLAENTQTSRSEL